MVLEGQIAISWRRVHLSQLAAAADPSEEGFITQRLPMPRDSAEVLMLSGHLVIECVRHNLNYKLWMTTFKKETFGMTRKRQFSFIISSWRKVQCS